MVHSYVKEMQLLEYCNATFPVVYLCVFLLVCVHVCDVRTHVCVHTCMCVCMCGGVRMHFHA